MWVMTRLSSLPVTKLSSFVKTMTALFPHLSEGLESPRNRQAGKPALRAIGKTFWQHALDTTTGMIKSG